MTRRRWLTLVVVVVSLVAAAGLRLALPELVRLAVVARVRAITGRTATLDAVEVAVLRGHVALRGFRLADRGEEAEPFAQFERLDLHLWLPALLRGHVWLREVTLRDPTVRVIRYPSDELNLSDLVRQSGETQGMLDVTVDRFVLVNGTTTLEDRALPEHRTWRTERIAIEAHGLSTRPQYGTAVGTSVMAGTPVSVEVTRLRLYPIDLQASLSIQGLDLAMGRVYLPPDAPVVLDQGRVSTSVDVGLDVREGLRLNAKVRLEDVVLTRRDGAALARLPALTVALGGLHFSPDGMALEHLALDGSGAVIDPSAPSAGQFASTTIRARISNLTWPVSTPAELDLETHVQGRGNLAVAGMLRASPAPSELRLRLDAFDLAPWAWFTPLSATLTGVAEADLRVNEPLRAGVPSRVRGAIAVRNIGVSEGRDRLLQVPRVEASGLELDWPGRLRIGRLAIRAPRAVVERGQAGDFALAKLWSSPASRGAPAPTGTGAARPPLTAGVEVRQVLVQDGAVEWRDRAVAPPVQATLSNLAVTVTGARWPIAGPLDLSLAGRPSGGGQLQLAGRVGLEPFTADARLTARAIDLSPYQPYLWTSARVSAWADLDLAVAVPAPDALPTVRGRAALARVDVRDGERTVLRIERATATGLEVEWPRRVAASQLVLDAPWILVERDERGAMPMRGLLPSGANGTTGSDRAPGSGETPGPIAMTVGQVSVTDGGARVVDRSISPPFAVDLRRLTGRVDGLSRAPGSPARIGLTGQAGPGTALALRGTVGPIGAPLQFDLKGELGGFAVRNANSYLTRYVAWQAQDGLLTVRFECGVRDDALDARADLRLSRLQVVRAAPDDATQAGDGLPLNLIVALLRDSRGDIRLSFPVGGRLSDPRFDFRETIRSAIRTVAINTIMLPVSWIGRLHVSPDSSIERVQVDPIRYQPATATLTEDGRTQATRVAAFLGQIGEVRMALTPVVSGRDLGELRRRAAEAAVERLAATARISPEAAATRLFRERLPDRQVPSEPEAVLAALADSEASPAHASTLAAQRVATLLAVLKEAGIAPARLVDTSVVERPDSTEGAIELNLVEPDAPRRSQLLQVLRRLGGTVTGAAEE